MALDTDKMQPRAKIFLDKFGKWDNWAYMQWIRQMVEKYQTSLGKTGWQSIADHDDFDRFLREEG